MKKTKLRSGDRVAVYHGFKRVVAFVQRVCFYNGERTEVVTIAPLPGKQLPDEMRGRYFHPKQCRKIKPPKLKIPRRDDCMDVFTCCLHSGDAE